MEEKGKSGVWRVGFIPHSTLAVWSACMWDSVGPRLLKELGPLHDPTAGQNVYGQWVRQHPVTVQRWTDGVVRLVVVEVPAAALGRLCGSDTEYQQYKLGARWADRLMLQVPKWGQFWTISPSAAPVV